MDGTEICSILDPSCENVGGVEGYALENLVSEFCEEAIESFECSCLQRMWKITIAFE